MMSSTGSAMVWGKDREGGRGERRKGERERERKKRQGSGKTPLLCTTTVVHNQEHVYLNWYFKQLFAVAMSGLCG